MRKVIAFITALVLFLCTAYSVHIYSNQALTMNNNAFGTWISRSKFASPDSIKANLNSDSLVVFGSSEFQHGCKTIYHPKAMFRGFSFNPMLIGAGYYQSLSHAITLASIGDSIPNKKVVLFVSPTWFRKSGVKDKAFATRFEEIDYMGMLKKSNISESTKKYIRNRVDTLLRVDPPTLKRVKLYNRILLDKKASFLDDLNYDFYEKFLTERSHQGVIIQAKIDNLKYNQKEGLKDRQLNWNKLIAKANAEGIKRNNNPFYMKPKSYAIMEAKYAIKKDSPDQVGFGDSGSPEYNDLRCFMDICHELKLKLMIVALPVNGYWFDYRNFPISERTKFYNNLRDIVSEYGVELTDLSDQEYNKYFFEDAVHLFGKGWVTVNEAIYNFYKEGQK